METIRSDKRYVTSYEASGALGIPTYKIDTAIRLYSVPHHKSGHTIFIRKDVLPHIKAFVEMLEQSGYAF
jgi:hypothetical protein